MLVAPQYALPLAASARFGFASGTLTIGPKTRVGVFCRKRPDRRRVRRSQVVELASGCSACGYETASDDTFDGNGNVIGLVNATTGALDASFEYDPFGNVIKAVGTAANVQPFGFSTKYTDTETSLCYYGYRYYSPATGRWTARDPIQEDGGLNLYGFVANEPLSLVDRNGLDPLTDWKNGAPPPDNGHGGWLAARFLMHYMGRSGADYIMSESEVRGFTILPKINVLAHQAVLQKFSDAIDNKQSSFEVTEADNALKVDYFPGEPDLVDANNALGAFGIRIKGMGKRTSCDPVKWKFTGDFRIEDRYDFNPLWAGHRSFYGNVKTVIMNAVPGVPFNVRSVWIHIEQEIYPLEDSIW